MRVVSVILLMSLAVTETPVILRKIQATIESCDLSCSFDPIIRPNKRLSTA